ncbi:MAG: TerB family tellurite resistance protein [Nannocystaceae bacterium]|nr:TerB family tellurite resistance protein [Nannocystaceae bacterium]
MTVDTDAIAFLYLAFAHATDGALSGEEMRTLAERLRGWRPEVGLDAIGEQIKSTVGRYKQLATREQRLAAANDQATALARTLTVEQRQRVLADLNAIAEVDGTVAEQERAFLDGIRGTLGV